ncbi:MAG: glycosyltransferase, partial [bacterium]|nr:glycosyltransferase [bacterium]
MARHVTIWGLRSRHPGQLDVFQYPPAQKEVLLSELPHVSVVMAVRNEATHIETTLRAVFDQDYEGPFEVVVADGRSTD